MKNVYFGEIERYKQNLAPKNHKHNLILDYHFGKFFLSSEVKRDIPQGSQQLKCLWQQILFISHNSLKWIIIFCLILWKQLWKSNSVLILLLKSHGN